MASLLYFAFKNRETLHLEGNTKPIRPTVSRVLPLAILGRSVRGAMTLHEGRFASSLRE